MASLADTLLARHGEEGLRDELKERLRAEDKITNGLRKDNIGLREVTSSGYSSEQPRTEIRLYRSPRIQPPLPDGRLTPIWAGSDDSQANYTGN